MADRRVDGRLVVVDVQPEYVVVRDYHLEHELGRCTGPFYPLPMFTIKDDSSQSMAWSVDGYRFDPDDMSDDGLLL